MKLLFFIFAHFCFLLFEEIPGQTDEGSKRMDLDLNVDYRSYLENKFHNYNVFEDGSIRKWPELVEARDNKNLNKWKNFCKTMSKRCENTTLRIACYYRAFIGGAPVLNIYLTKLQSKPCLTLDLLRCECWEELRKTNTTDPFYVSAYKDSQYFMIERLGPKYSKDLTVTDLIHVDFPECAVNLLK